MACDVLKFPAGGQGWLCHTPEEVKCKTCGESADYLCDGHDPEDVDGVCSAGLCRRHRKIVDGKDLCPRCFAEHDAFPRPEIPEPPASTPRPVMRTQPELAEPQPPPVRRPAVERLIPFLFDGPEIA
jgi:hypothetical protein